MEKILNTDPCNVRSLSKIKILKGKRLGARPSLVINTTLRRVNRRSKSSMQGVTVAALLYPLFFFGGVVKAQKQPEISAIVPELRGLRLEQASQILLGHSLQVGKVSEISTGQATVGTIVQQSPLPNTPVNVGMPVNLVIEAASPAPPPPPDQGIQDNQIPPYSARRGPNDTLWIAVLLAIFGGAAITLSLSIRNRSRKRWQENSKKEEPPERCQHCTRYCRKIEIGLEPARRKIAYLILTSRDSASNKEGQNRQVSAEIVDRLNEAVTARRSGEKIENLEQRITLASQRLLQYTSEWVRPKGGVQDVSIDGHLRGGRVTCQFVLYHCKRKGDVNFWEEEKTWKATVKDERKEPVTVLYGLNPNEPTIPERLLPELAQSLTQFVMKV